MSDRAEFEKWYVDTFDRRPTDVGYETDICWQAWQAARAQGGEGAEPVGYLHKRPERIPCFFESHDEAMLSGCEVVPVYTHPQPAQQGVPEAWLLRKQAETVVPAIMRALTDMGNADLTYSGARIYAEEYAQRLRQQAEEIEKSGANQ